MIETSGVGKDKRERWWNLFLQSAVLKYNIEEMELCSFVCSAWILASAILKL
jgi:hypothetical protein